MTRRFGPEREDCAAEFVADGDGEAFSGDGMRRDGRESGKDWSMPCLVAGSRARTAYLGPAKYSCKSERHCQ